MKPLLPLLCLSALWLLGACAAVPGQQQVAAAPFGAMDAAGADGVAGEKYSADGVIGFQGFGPAPFGAGEEDVRMAWGRDMGDSTPDEPGGCHYLLPHPRQAAGEDRIGFMIHGGRFVRIDVAAADIPAPGGGRTGQSAERIGVLYGDAVQQLPHKYTPGAAYLRIPDPAGSRAVLVFETGSDGDVERWRIGLEPEVDWVERCG